MSFYLGKSDVLPLVRQAPEANDQHGLLDGEAGSAACRRNGDSHQGTASFKSALTNLIMSSLGAGQLTLPFVLNEMGLGLGCVAMLSCSLLSAYSCTVLARCSRALGVRTYSELILVVFGKSAKAFADMLFVLYAWGGSVSFLIIVKDLLERITWLEHFVSGRTAMAMLTLGIIFPLSLLRDLNRLKFTSVFGCLSALASTLVVVANAPWDSSWRLEACAGDADASSMRIGPASFVEAFAALPLIAFALNSSWAFLNIFNTLDQAAQREKGSRLIVLALTAVLTNYLVISVIGYVSYCEATTPDILDSLPPRDGWKGALVAVVRLMLLMQLTFALPLRFNVARCVIEARVKRLSRGMRILITLGLIVSALVVAECPLKLNVVIGVTSAICASFIIDIFPAALDISLRFRAKGIACGPEIGVVVAVVVMFFGVVLLVAGTLANIMAGVR